MTISKSVQEILLDYDGVLITYEVEQVLKRKLMVDSRGQIIRYFCNNGYFLNWQNLYNAKGKKLYIPSRR